MKNEALSNQKQSFQSKAIQWGLNAIPIVFGSILFAVLAQVAIPLPFTPVPLSLQTLGVAVLAIFLGKHGAPLAIITYLLQATLGFPVLAGGVANPLWMIGPRAGYLLAFAVSSYVLAKLLERHSCKFLFKTWLIFSVNETIILLIGSLWLSLFVGLEKAFYMGLLPFVPGALIKITLATSLLRPARWLQKRG